MNTHKTPDRIPFNSTGGDYGISPHTILYGESPYDDSPYNISIREQKIKNIDDIPKMSNLNNEKSKKSKRKNQEITEKYPKKNKQEINNGVCLEQKKNDWCKFKERNYKKI